MNDTEKLNWLLKEAGFTRTDLDNALETDKLLDDIVASMRGDRHCDLCNNKNCRKVDGGCFNPKCPIERECSGAAPCSGGLT